MLSSSVLRKVVLSALSHDVLAFRFSGEELLLGLSLESSFKGVGDGWGLNASSVHHRLEKRCFLRLQCLKVSLVFKSRSYHRSTCKFKPQPHRYFSQMAAISGDATKA